MICKFCLEERKLVRCHIIPRSFYKSLINPHALIISDKSYPKRSQTGIYDENLICEECETLFSPSDDYAYRLLSADISEDNLIVYNGKRIAYIINDYNYGKLKLFFISLLWRASASHLTYFARIKAKPFESQLKEMVRKKDPGTEDDFPIALRRFEEKSYSTAILDPYKRRFDGINYSVFYLSGFTVYIKVDKRLAPDFIRDINIKPNNPLVILLIDIEKTKEYKIMKKLAEKNREKFGK